MHKKLFKFGNSMAIVIDAAYRRQLGLDEETLLHVAIEGRKITIVQSSCDLPEKTDKPLIATRTHYDHYRLQMLCRELDGFGLDRERFRQLSLDGSNLFELHGVITCAGPVDAVMVARLSACAEKRRAGISWPETIAAVLAEVPATSERVRLVAQ